MRSRRSVSDVVASEATLEYSKIMKKGAKHSDEAKEKNRVAHVGKRTGKSNNKWKGNRVGYHALHDWIRDNYGRPTKCENKTCPRTSSSYQWSNVSGQYKRHKEDWQQLCASCHKKYDYRPTLFCRNGHELKLVGILVDNRGSRICKECKRVNARIDYQRHKEQIIKRVTQRRKLIRSTIHL